MREKLVREKYQADFILTSEASPTPTSKESSSSESSYTPAVGDVVEYLNKDTVTQGLVGRGFTDPDKRIIWSITDWTTQHALISISIRR
jgi:hypothetical protein